MKHRFVALTAALTLAACGEAPTEPTMPVTAPDLAPSLTVLSNAYVSGTHVLAYDPIFPAAAYPDWVNTVCGGVYNTTNPPAPLYGPTDPAWGTQTHNAFVPTTANGSPSTHPWAYIVGTPWINAWNDLASMGPGGHSWTRYEMPVEGNGTFELKLIADNCSWVFIDNTLAGFQPVGGEQAGHRRTYGVTLNGVHTLTFIIFDGGGAAGGNFSLTTTSNPPPPLNPDLDGDSYPNDQDAFPLDPNEWADSDGDGVGDNGDAFPDDPTEWADTDGDGVGDGSDAYPLSDTRATVSCGACTTGVPNRVLGNGATFNDLIAAARASARNHGKFVSAVADLTDSWKKAGLITGREEGAITSCAARSK